MDLKAWQERYRSELDSKTELTSVPTPLLAEVAAQLSPGRALDLACGAGRNALWLAQRGWSVTAVDGSTSAIDILQRKAHRLGVKVNTQVADFEKTRYAIAPGAWDLIAMCYYLDRKLLESCKPGLAPRGVIVVIAVLVEPDKKASAFRLQSGELRSYFKGWEILHDREGHDLWRHRVAELVARRPPEAGTPQESCE